MKLSQLFSGEVRTDTSSHPSQTQMTPAQMESINRQIRSLVPGQTISGEIIARNGSEVQIRLSEDLVLNARVDRNMNIEIGKNMTFEVKNNGSALTLSPLFTNVATDMNVLKALDMAGLPVNGSTVQMTQQLMAAGMSVNKTNLQQIFREINNFPQAEIADVIHLHKLQMPVNEANINQMISYRNLSHQLTGGMETILEGLPEVLDSMVEEGNLQGAAKLYQELLDLVREGAGQGLSGEENGLPGPAGTVSGNGEAQAGQTVPGTGGESLPGSWAEGQPRAEGQPGAESQPGAVQTAGPGPANLILNAAEELAGAERNLPEGKDVQDIPGGRQESAGNAPGQVQENPAREAIPDFLRAGVAREAESFLNSLRLPAPEASAARAQILQFAQGKMSADTFFSFLSTLAEGAKFSAASMRGLHKLFSGAGFRELFSRQLKNNWTLRPEEVASREKVEDLYNRMDRQLRNLTTALENAGQNHSSAYRAASSMSQNLDFLQQLNQMYAYVQLPLKLQQREAHGDLYVYTNKKKLASPEAGVSALLHLDMEYLGSLDVYVVMKNAKVNTKFYLQDDEMIGFMAAHMDILTDRLKKRGYDCSFAMVRRDEHAEEATKGGLEPLLRQEKGIMLSHYAFDVRT